MVMDGEKSITLQRIVNNCDGWTQNCDLFDRARYMSLIVSDTSFVLAKLTFLLRLKSLQERNKVEIKRDYQIVRFQIIAAWWQGGYIDISYIGVLVVVTSMFFDHLEIFDQLEIFEHLEIFV